MRQTVNKRQGTVLCLQKVIIKTENRPLSLEDEEKRQRTVPCLYNRRYKMEKELKIAKLALKALDEKKGKDIKVIDIREVSVIADYFIIASAANENQVQAMMESVEETLGRAGFEPKQIEGNKSSSWVLMDYNDVIIHIFDEENRLFYDLERIWRDGKTLELSYEDLT